jgi:hypothetical protein
MDIAPYLNSKDVLRVLDLGNGSLRPQYTLLQAACHLTYGIDLVNRPQWNSFNAAYGPIALSMEARLTTERSDENVDLW